MHIISVKKLLSLVYSFFTEEEVIMIEKRLIITVDCLQKLRFG